MPPKSSAVVPVVAQEWQYACCGKPFSVGDRVAWKLTFIEAERSFLPEELMPTLDLVAAPYGRAFHPKYPTVIRGDGIAAYWLARSRTEGRVRVSGVLHEEHHGGVPNDLEPTVGTVRRIRVLWTEHGSYDHGRTRIYELIRGGVDLREVSSSADDRLAGGERPPRNYLLKGWAVDLEVDPTGGAQKTSISA